MKKIWRTYGTSNAEEALGFTSDDVRWSKENVFAHWLEKPVAAIAVITAQAVQDDVNAFRWDSNDILK